jgi:glycerophosphoryl diester phosphodiesterase
VATLNANGYTKKSDPVFIQSFEVGNLKELSQMTKVRLVQLMDVANRQPFDFVAGGDPRTYGDLMTPKGLREMATYADGIGPSKDSIVPRDAQANLLPPTTLVKDAHRAGLTVHPYTFRRENSFLPLDFRQGNPASPLYLAAPGDLPAELRLFFSLGVDGLFTDNSDIAVAVRSTL